MSSSSSFNRQKAEIKRLDNPPEGLNPRSVWGQAPCFLLGQGSINVLDEIEFENPIFFWVLKSANRVNKKLTIRAVHGSQKMQVAALKKTFQNCVCS